MAQLLVALAVIATMSAQREPPQVRVEPAPGHLSIDAVAVDRNGLPVTDLRPAELEVWINGYRVPIETLTVMAAKDTGSGRSIVLLLDDITLEPAILPRARDAARRFVERMSPGDQMAIVTLNGISIIESTGDRARLLQSLNAYTTRATGVMRLDTLAELLFGTITSISRRFAETSDRRKTVVAIGSSWLLDTPVPPPTVGRDFRPEWTEAMRAMASANVTLYVIDPAGLGMSRTLSGSSGFARETGGYAFANTNDVDGAVERIMREAGFYYVIDIADPPVGRKADLRELDVRVLRRGITVRARRAIPGVR